MASTAPLRPTSKLTQTLYKHLAWRFREGSCSVSVVDFVIYGDCSTLHEYSA